MPWMKSEGLFMYKTILTSGKTCVIGWLKKSSPQLTNKDTLTKEFTELCKTSITFQINSRVIINESVLTKALAIECSIDDAKQLSADIYQNYVCIKKNYINSISYKLQYIPTRPSGAITNDIIKKSIVEQNRFLRHILRITVTNVNDIDSDLPMPTKNGLSAEHCLRDWLQNAINEKTKTSHT